MKIAITARGTTLEDEMDPRFGRCGYFALHDTDTGETAFVENTAAGARGGAGPQASRLITDHGARALITGNVGPNAFEVLNASGIRVLVSEGGTVAQVIERYANGELKEVSAPSVDSHAGM